MCGTNGTWIEFEIAQELWNLLIPLDPASSFPPEHLAMWITFLTEKGGRAVSKDSWNLVRPPRPRSRRVLWPCHGVSRF